MTMTEHSGENAAQESVHKRPSAKYNVGLTDLYEMEAEARENSAVCPATVDGVCTRYMDGANHCDEADWADERGTCQRPFPCANRVPRSDSRPHETTTEASS